MLGSVVSLGCQHKIYLFNKAVEMTHVLLIGDETTLPAIKGILEQLAQQSNPVQVQAFIEMPLEADCVDMSAFAFA
ncbi:hypothetical protein EXD76_05500 [BEV proteobacterium]|nr:hypothetical protein [Candidatus Symbiopectobacterium sp. Chty_BC]